MAKREKVTGDDVRTVVKAQPLVNLSRAAEMLGVKPPNIGRLREQGRMPEPVDIEGGRSMPAYVKSEVKALAAELAAEREARAEARV